MGSSINLSLTDDLREKKDRLEASQLRDSILVGLQDIAYNSTTVFSGDLRADMNNRKKNKRV